MPPRIPSPKSPHLRSLLFQKPTPHRLSSSSSSTPKTLHSRLTTLLSHLPKSTQRYTTPLLHAPKTHIVSFLLLHELTAILPLIGLGLTFHYTSFLPTSFTDGKAVKEGVERFGKYFARKGWFGFSQTIPEVTGEEDIAKDEGGSRSISTPAQIEGEEEAIEQKWNTSQNGSRILIEVATAYAITKVLLPVRVVVSVWGTPWFARVVVGRVGGLFTRFARKKGVGKGRMVAAGTGATGGGVIGKGS